MRVFIKFMTIWVGSTTLLHADFINVTKYETVNSCDHSISFRKMRFAICMTNQFYGTTCAPYIYQSGYINGCYYSPSLSINAFMSEEKLEEALTYAGFAIINKSSPEKTE